jgi:hypothetical protein
LEGKLVKNHIKAINYNTKKHSNFWILKNFNNKFDSRTIINSKRCFKISKDLLQPIGVSLGENIGTYDGFGRYLSRLKQENSRKVLEMVILKKMKK